MSSPRSQTAGEAVATLTAEQSSEYDEFDEEVALISQTRRGPPMKGPGVEEEEDTAFLIKDGEESGDYEAIDIDEIKLHEKKVPKENREFDTLPKDYEDERKQKEEFKARRSSKQLR